MTATSGPRRAELRRRTADRRKVNLQALESRRAALNLMEDAVQAAEVLGQRTAQYETLLNRAPIGVYLVDADFAIRQVNPIARPFFGEIPDLIGRSFEEVIHLLWTQECADETVRIFRHTLETGEPYEAAERSEYRIDRKVTEYYDWRVHRIPLPEGGYGVVCYFRDVSAQVADRAAIAESQERLRQATKMEAIGRLAGGLAHDFNNQLQVMSGFADGVSRDPGLSERSSRDLREIRKAADRLTSLTRQLLAYSRQQILLPETLDLNVALRDGQNMVQRLIGSDIQMVLQLAPTPLWVRVDPGQLLQVLMNLAINARDSMVNGGELLVETGSVKVRPKQLDRVAGAVVVPGRYARLVVTDSGAGIASEDLPHLFEPFFTTKEIGKGTGLGLATVQGIVMQSDGYVWAENAPGGGAVFTVLLPLVSEPALKPSRPVQRSHPNGGPARLLLVEDEDTVRDMLARVLKDDGFEVVEAAHGGEALNRLEETGGGIDLVISDIVMPVMSGRQLAERLAAEYPDLPAIWMSGYPRDTAFGSGIPREDHPFLQKPVTIDLLLDTVRQVLEHRVGTGGNGVRP